SGSGLLGCTAFAIDSEQGPIHARNLDWWSENGLLRNATVIYNYEKGGTTIFKAISWPGYAAVLSGAAPGRFAITLNAVLSGEKAQIARSISFLIREVLEEASDFGAAVDKLSSTQISADCLLLVTGTRKGEMCVIERTPRHSEIREPESDHIIVTNDYRKLRDSGIDRGSDLDLTTWGRFERVETFLRESRPQSFNEFFRILRDQEVCMDITMQHMVMSAAENRLEVRLPDKRV
ncbi:MAG: C45 family autoproteolytic acyltransferase/hydrolase, partial [bacterium]